MNALVTGCAGFVGSHLTESLLMDGHDVVGVDCFNDNYARRDKFSNLARLSDHERFTFVPVDLASGGLEEIVAEREVIYHLAAEPGVRTSWGARFDHFVRNNVLATQRLLEALTSFPGVRLVYASSSSVYGNAERLPTSEDDLPQPYSPYGVTKLAAEHLCSLYTANFGVPTTSLRYFTVYGPRQRPDMAFHRWCRAAVLGEPLTVFGDGLQTRDFTYVGDIVAATRSAGERAEAAGRVYNVGGGSRLSVNATLDIIAGLAGRPLAIERVAREDGDVRATGADNTRARADLGFDPATPVEDGLAAEFAWLAERVALAADPAVGVAA
jgi:nucleoside-diphosphate-sugar epimerase